MSWQGCEPCGRGSIRRSSSGACLRCWNTCRGYPWLTAAAESGARREDLGKETVRRWVVQAQIDGGQRQGATSEELAEITDLEATVCRLEDDTGILRRASIVFAGELDPRGR